MSELRQYQQEIEALATQLEKLLKVINHSDPSAEKMKYVLYEKYKLKLADLAREIKVTISWTALNHYLEKLTSSSSFPVDEDSREVVINKLVKDFEGEFIVRHELSEFSAPDPVDERQKHRIRRIRQQIRINRLKKTNNFKADDIVDMYHLKFQQKTAKKSLDKLVKAFSKIEVPETEN